MIICKKCGIELEDDQLYCPLCGEPTHGMALANEAKMNDVNKRKSSSDQQQKQVFYRHLITALKKIFHV